MLPEWIISLVLRTVIYLLFRNVFQSLCFFFNLHLHLAKICLQNVVQHNLQPTECSHGPRNIKNGVCVSVYKTDWQENRYRFREKQAERDKQSKLKYRNNLANKFSVTKTHILLAHDNLMQHNRRDGIIRIELGRSG